MQQNFTPIDNLIQHYKNNLSSSFTKETEPRPLESVEYQKVVEHEPEEDVQRYVQHRPETIKLDSDMEKMGVEASGSSDYQTTQGVTLPLSDAKIIEGLDQPMTSSWRWLATLALYLLKQTHYTLKKVHGHIRRVAFS